MICATYSVYIAILKEIRVNLVIFTPQKGVFSLLGLKLDHLKKPGYTPSWKKFGAIPPLSTRTLPTTEVTHSQT